MIQDPIEGIAKTLGGKRLLGNVRSSLDLHEHVKAGLPFQALKALAGHVKLSTSKVAVLIGMAPATYDRRRRGEKPLTATESETLSRVARILVLGTNVFGSTEDTWNWLLKKNKGFDGERPIDLLRTEPGGREVEAIIGRRLYGGYD